MTRDELILYFQPVVESIVMKYNDHVVDEDLKSIGTIKSIEAIDRCLEDKMTDIELIKKRVIVWVRNKILDAIYVRNNVNNVDNIDDYEVGDETDYAILYADVKASLKGIELEIFNLLNEGYTPKDICKKLGIEKSKYYQCESKIKKTIMEN